MKAQKVFIATSSFGEDDPSVLKMLTDAGLAYTLNPYRRRLNEAEIVQGLVEGEYTGLLAGLEPLTRNALAQAKALKVISRVGVGMDNVDQGAAKELGIKVFNTPGVLTDSVAELTLGLMLSALRKIPLMDRQIREGRWVKSMGALLKGKTVGIVGFGAIGQRVAELVLAFGAKVVFTDVHEVIEAGAQQVPLAELIAQADIISFHSSGKECLVSDNEIARMKEGVILVNTARGSLIDEGALARGLSSGKIGAAALDVFCDEPYAGGLAELDTTVLTAHVGSYAREARVQMERMAVVNLINAFKDN